LITFTNRPSWVVYFLLVLLVCGSIPTFADNGWEGQILSVTDDNDAVIGTDRHYTQGARISYFSSDEALPRWLQNFSRQLPAIGLEVQACKFGLAIGQEIYTPQDLSSVSVVPNDRPYAGWLFGSLLLQRRGPATSVWQAKEIARVDLGVIGPESLAQAAQEATHRVKPRGWQNQLKTEVGFNFGYERRYLCRLIDKDQRWGTDLIPSFRASGGTVSTFLAAGTTLRFGYRTPDEFEAPRQPTPVHFGAYVFSVAEGRYVIRNIFLDGSTFTSSPHIEKKPLVADLSLGLTVVLKSVELTVTHVFRTPEFIGQQAYDSYDSATVTLKF